MPAAIASAAAIPNGSSHSGVCTDVGRYDCGYAMGTNPMPFLFPCHRVTRGSEVPDAYLGGAERRERMLAIERGG